MLFTTDQQTIEDLNIFGKHSGTSIYSIFNRTFTRGGAELLEQMFRFPLSTAAAINRRSGIIQYFAAIPVFPFDTEIFDMIEQYLINVDERTKITPQGDKVSNRITNLILDDPNYKTIHRGVHSVIHMLNSFRSFIDQLKMVSQTPYQKDREDINNLLSDPAFISFTGADQIKKLSYAKLAEFDQLIRFRHREKIKKLLQYIYELDVYLSVGKIAALRHFIFPKANVNGTSTLILEGVYHPQIEHAISNDVQFSHHSNVVFLTGANMAGKSTTMKSLGIAVYLAHMGFPVPATRMEFPVLDGIYTTINLPDNLGMGTSHFYAEVLRIKKIAKELSLSKKLFIIIDELFRGTNVKDAYEATVVITEAFANKINSMFVISTHIIEAGDVLKDRCSTISFKYLPTHLKENMPIYTYKLENGITADRHGMIIINNEGILDILQKGKGKRS